LLKYFPNRQQMALFGNTTEEEYVRIAYLKKNKEIGHKEIVEKKEY